MPWTPADAEQHIAGLTAHQRLVWSKVANALLRSCLTGGGDQSECEGRAVRQATSVAKRAPTKAIKAAEGGALDILAIPFSGQFDLGDGKGRDFDGQFFGPSVDLCLPWYPQHRPLLWSHGLEDGQDTPGAEPIGSVDTATVRKTAEGYWVTAQLDASSKYWRHIMRLLEQDALYASSGAMSHLVKVAGDGEIMRWPWVELSLTPTPSNLFAVVLPAEAKAHYKSAGLDLPDEGDALDIIETVGIGYGKALDALLVSVPEFMARTRTFDALRLKDGRPQFTSPRRQRLAALLDAFRHGAADLEELLAETEPRAREIVEAVAEVVALAEPAKAKPADSILAGLRDQYVTYAAWRAHYAGLTQTNGDD